MSNLINSLNFGGSTSTITLPIGYCTDAQNVTNKSVQITNFALEDGAMFLVCFVNGHNQSTLTLNINGTGDKEVKFITSPNTTNFSTLITADATYVCVYHQNTVGSIMGRNYYELLSAPSYMIQDNTTDGKAYRGYDPITSIASSGNTLTLNHGTHEGQVVKYFSNSSTTHTGLLMFKSDRLMYITLTGEYIMYSGLVHYRYKTDGSKVITVMGPVLKQSGNTLTIDTSLTFYESVVAMFANAHNNTLSAPPYAYFSSQYDYGGVNASIAWW